jgi:hypothetical protein
MKFILTNVTTLSSSAGGVLTGFIPFDPATITYNEYASLGALFDEVKLDRVSSLWQPLVGATGVVGTTVQIFNTFQVGVDRDAINTATASYSQVLRLDGSVAVARVVADNLPIKTSYVAPPGRLYASTAVPSTINPPSGAVGMFRYATNAGVTASRDYYIVVTKATMWFRNRV